ncbi:MAG: DUF1631 domain-containing protein [Burkholderiaceae bacterium]|nr:DUF1631 domain-containing protein [Burkholderiaceae bacterium]
MFAPAPLSSQRDLARQVRQQFVKTLAAGLVEVDQAVFTFLTSLIDQTGTQREMQSRRDAWQLYGQRRADWVQATRRVWEQAQNPPTTPIRAATAAPLDFSLELISDDVVENKIVASRIALTVLEAVSGSFDALRRRVQMLEGQELVGSDLLRPETFCLLLVEQWVVAGLSRTDLQAVLDPLQRELAARAQVAYQRCNDFLGSQGIAQPETQLRVSRPPGGGGSNAGAGSRMGELGSSGAVPAAAALASQRAGLPSSGVIDSGPGAALRSVMAGAASLVGATPLARARERAYGVMGQLRRLMWPGGMAQGVPMMPPAAQSMMMGAPLSGVQSIMDAPGSVMADATAMQQAPPASAALAQALAQQQIQAQTYYSSMAGMAPQAGPVAVVQLVGAVRERAAELKKQAGTDSEKAIIEVVALMFQSILSEDRIPPAVRVLFARLQVPVLRVALAEPDFFSDLNHPARLLIDRMGACVMGFDATAIDGSALEAEIRRVVQVIEQYPETGRKVFQLVREEFEAFLAKFLTQKKSTARVVTVAQQVEQRETLTIQYTIELRTLLKDMPVRDEIRDFLFKTWAEVLALSAVRAGAQHPDTLALKRTAADLVWAASAKPHRSDRSKVIQSLPGLLDRLRQGLALVNMSGDAQETQIKVLTDVLAQAFVSKTEPIAQEQIETLARGLENLEDCITEAVLGDMPLDAEAIEMMLGIDMSNLSVIADNDAPVEDAVVEWARQLQVGAWFTIDHNGSAAQVQYVWHSQRQQLHLFAAPDGRSYLLQLRRLAAYLQTGLLTVQDEEGLTVRAARDALAKLDANPERLLQ